MAETTSQAAAQVAQQASQAAQAAAQEARQAAQQSAQQAGETVRQVMDASRTAASQEVGAEREMEIGKDEAWFANIKRTYDEFQQESLESIRRNRTYVDKVIHDAQQHDNARQIIANQALQNAVETANMLGKQTVVNLDSLNKQHQAHRDIATDRTWNVDEVAALVAKSAIFQDAIAAAVALGVQRAKASA